MEIEKQKILDSYCFELEVTDAWQLPAVYKIYKENKEINVNESDFSLKVNDQEYKKIIEKILSFNIESWENNYELNIGEKAEEQYSWKLVVYYDDNKKIIKRGKDTSPEEFADLEEFLIEITE